jgi:hypothetical protein
LPDGLGFILIRLTFVNLYSLKQTPMKPLFYFCLLSGLLFLGACAQSKQAFQSDKLHFSQTLVARHDSLQDHKSDVLQTKISDTCKSAPTLASKEKQVLLKYKHAVDLALVKYPLSKLNMNNLTTHLQLPPKADPDPNNYDNNLFIKILLVLDALMYAVSIVLTVVPALQLGGSAVAVIIPAVFLLLLIGIGILLIVGKKDPTVDNENENILYRSKRPIIIGNAILLFAILCAIALVFSAQSLGLIGLILLLVVVGIIGLVAEIILLIGLIRLFAKLLENA